MSILFFLIILVVLVLVHEFGHFVAAKLFGMRVDEFGIGFPPRLIGVRRGETLYSLNALPIGGFVRILGEDASEAATDPRAFSRRPRVYQALVLVAGVLMNVLLAWIIFVGAYLIGVETAVTESSASPDARLVVTDVLPGGPAYEARIPLGADITALSAGEDELDLMTPSAFQSFVEEHAGEAIALTYMEGSQSATATLTPQTGVIADAPDRPAIGIAFSLVEVVATPFPQALREGTALTYETLRDITVGLGMLLWNAVHARADLSAVTGPVGIVGLVGQASAFGATSLLMFAAFISLNLAVINLLPFPALDGGRLLFVAIEAAKGSPIRPSLAAALNAAGFALIILLMIVVTIHDIVRVM
jgi:regulator of sigma E protease